MSQKPRIYLDTDLSVGIGLSLSIGHANYLMKVLRCKDGDEVLVFNKYAEYEARIEIHSKKDVSVEMLSLTRNAISKHKLTLAFAPVKNPNASFYVQKATELGVTDILPVITERTIVRTVKADKLGIVAVEATEQSDQFCPPVVHETINLERLCSEAHKYNRVIFCDEARDSDALATVIGTQQNNDLILIGSEGGFSASERELIRSLPNAVAVSLGDGILRAETAMILAVGAYRMLNVNPDQPLKH